MSIEENNNNNNKNDENPIITGSDSEST